MKRIIQKLIIFLKEVRLEIKKINWPTRKETVKYTLVVIGVCLAIAAFLGAADFFFSLFIKRFVL